MTTFVEFTSLRTVAVTEDNITLFTGETESPNSTRANDLCSVFLKNRSWRSLPDSICFSFAFAVVMILVFYAIRKLHHKKEPFYNDWDINWLQFIYSDRTVEDLHPPNRINPLHVDAFYPKYLQGFLHLFDNRLVDNERRTRLHICNQIQERFIKEHAKKLANIGKDRFWLFDYIDISLNDIHKHRGRDAYIYIKFQQYLLILMTFMAIVSVVIILPINMQGELITAKFEATTISNISIKSNMLWIHVLCSIIFIIVAMIVMKKFYESLYVSDAESLINFLRHGEALSTDRRSLLIQNIPESHRNAQVLKKLIEMKFPGVFITRISFTYDIKNLRYLIRELRVMESALYFTVMYENLYGIPRMVSPYTGSRYIPACPEVNGVSYYHKMIRKLRQCIKDELATIIGHPQNQVFVRFKTKIQAQKFLEYFEKSNHLRVFRQCLSDYNIPIEKGRGNYRLWTALNAPAPEDIVWRDIHESSGAKICSFTLRLTTVLLFLFLTTPLAHIDLLGDIWKMFYLSKIDFTVLDVKNRFFNIPLADWIGVICLNTLSMTLPNIIMLLEWNVPLKTKSERAHSMMKAMYFFLLIMLLLLPSTGANSLFLFGSNLLKRTRAFFDCVLPIEMSSWYVSLIMSCAIISNCVEFLRVPDLGIYFINSIIFPKTAAEYEKARMETPFVYNISSSYARILAIFTITATYCVGSPIITLAGLLYMIGKHLADRYTLYYLYRIPVVSIETHICAGQFILFAFLWLILQLVSHFNKLNSHFELLVVQPLNVCILLVIIYGILLVILYFSLNKFNPFRKGSSTRTDKAYSFDSSFKGDLDDDQLIKAMENFCEFYEKRRKMKKLKLRRPKSIIKTTS